METEVVSAPKKRGRPRRVEVLPDQLDGEDLQTQIAGLQQQVQALLAQKTAGGGITEEQLERMLNRVAGVTAEAQERAANPSNKTHPGISVYSREKGDRADRRDDLKCPMFWVGYPIDWNTTTDEEINLLNAAEPGEYMFRRTDGSPERLTVVGDKDASGKLTRLLFQFLTSERRDSLPSMVAMLRDAFKVKTPEQLELERLRAEVEALRTHAA